MDDKLLQEYMNGIWKFLEKDTWYNITLETNGHYIGVLSIAKIAIKDSLQD